jgi:predicted metalloprotease
MTTVINNPGENSNADASGGSGVVVGAVLVVLVLIVVIVLSLPYIRQKVDNMSKPANPTINVTLPSMQTANTTGGTPAPTTK